MKLFVRAHDLGVKGISAVADKLNLYGLDGIQLVGYKVLDGIEYRPCGMDERTALSVAQTLRSAQKTIPLVGAYFNPVHSSIQKVELGKQVFCNYLDYCRALGADTVGSETGSYNDDKWTYNPQNRTDEALLRATEVFGYLAEYAAKLGVNIAVEGAFNHVCYSPKRLARLVDAINMPNVKVIFDLYNYLHISNVDNRYDILQQGLQMFGNKICVFHIKDCVVSDGKLHQCAVGKGIFDYDKILKLIYQSNTDAKLVFEGTTGDDLPESIQFIKQGIQRL